MVYRFEIQTRYEDELGNNSESYFLDYAVAQLKLMQTMQMADF